MHCFCLYYKFDKNVKKKNLNARQTGRNSFLIYFKYVDTFIGTRFVVPPFYFFFNSSLLWDVFIIKGVEQLQTLPKTQSEIDISPFLKTQKSSILYSIII